MKKEISYNFTITLWSAFLVFAATSALSLFFLFYPTDKDYLEYRALVSKANPTNSNVPTTPYKATQRRKNTQKDVMFIQGSDQLHLSLNSLEADVILDHRNESTELIEKMRGVTCLMQEELFYILPDGREVIKHANGKLLLRQGDFDRPSSWINPAFVELKPMQRIRYLEAEAATYYYKSEQLVAEQVKIFRYTMPGHKIPTSFLNKKLEMKGVARSVQFSLSGGELNFKARNFKASFYNPESFL